MLGLEHDTFLVAVRHPSGGIARWLLHECRTKERGLAAHYLKRGGHCQRMVIIAMGLGEHTDKTVLQWKTCIVRGPHLCGSYFTTPNFK